MTPSPDLESLAQEVGDKVHADFKFGDGSAVEPIILSALQSAVAYERERTLEEAAKVAERVSFNYHGTTEETPICHRTTFKISDAIRSLKSNKGERG